VKPAPLMDAALIVTGIVPVDVKVTVWLPVEPTATLPKVRLEELAVSAGVAAFSCTEAVLETPLTLLVIVAV